MLHTVPAGEAIYVENNFKLILVGKISNISPSTQLPSESLFQNDNVFWLWQ